MVTDELHDDVYFPEGPRNVLVAVTVDNVRFLRTCDQQGFVGVFIREDEREQMDRQSYVFDGQSMTLMTSL